MTHAANLCLDYLWDMTVQATVLLALAALATMCSRRLAASFRHYVWVSCLLALPFLGVHSLFIRVRPLVVAPTAHAMPSPVVPAATRAFSTANAAAPAPLALPDTRTPSILLGLPSPTRPLSVAFPDWRPALCALWIVGAVISLGRLAAGLAEIRVLMRASIPIEDGPVAEAAALLHLDSSRVVFWQALSPETASVPMTWGVFHPVILLPADADTWPYDRLRAVLWHETAHVRRGDWLTQTLIRVICAALWFHPVVWLAARACRAESERACDDCVLSAGVAAPEYAQHLLDVARAASSRRMTGAVAMAQTARIETRLKNILAAKRDRRPLTRSLWLGALTVSLVMIGTAGVLVQALGMCGVVPVFADQEPLTTLYTFTVPTGKDVDKAEGLVNDDGAAPVALVQGKDGNFYGTALGGDQNAGTIFRFTCPNVGKAFSKMPQTSVAAPPKSKALTDATTTTTQSQTFMSGTAQIKNKIFTDVTMTITSPTTTTYHDHGSATSTTTQGGAVTTIHCGSMQRGPNGSWVLSDVTITRPGVSQTHVKSMTLRSSDKKSMFEGDISKIEESAESNAPAPQ